MLAPRNQVSLRVNEKAQKSRRSVLRRLTVETLENRQLMAVDALLATNESANALQIYSPQGVIQKSIPLPGDFATDPSRYEDGKVLVADQLRGIISADLKTGVTQQKMPGRFLSVAYNAAHKEIVAADTSTKQLLAVRDGESPRVLLNIDGTVTCIQVFESNYYLSISKDGRTRIDRYDLNTKQTTTIHSSLGSIEAFTIHTAQRRIYFADQGREILGYVHIDGSSSGIIAGNVRLPKGIAFTNSDTLAVSSVGSKTIELFHVPTGTRTILVANTGNIEGLLTLEDPTASPAATKPNIALLRKLPAETVQSDEATLAYFDPESPKKEPPLKGGIEHNEVYDPNSPIPWDEKVNEYLEMSGDVLAIAGLFIGEPGKGTDPNKPIKASSTTPHGVTYGANKNDELNLNHARSQGIGGKGADQFQLNAPNTTAYGNQDNDTFHFNSKSGTAIGGPGVDTYHISPSSTDNNIYDASPHNNVKYPGELAELDVKVVNKDVIISTGDKTLATIHSINLSNQEVVLSTSDHKVGLSVLSKVPHRDAVRASIAAYSDRRQAMEKDIKESGYTLNSRKEVKETGLEMSVWKRNYAPALTGDVTTDVVPVDGQYVISIAGTQDEKDFAIFGLAPDLQARTVIQEGQKLISEKQASIITLTGHSGGGEEALRAGRQLAMDNPNVQIDVVMINSGGVSLLSMGTYELPNLHITHLRNEADILSNPATNIARGMIVHKEPLVYPSNVETITIPYNNAGPDFKTNPQGWIKYHHEAERVLEYLNNDSTPNRLIRSSSTDSSSFTMPVQFSDLSPEIQTPIITATKALVSMDGALPVIPKLEMNFDFGAKTFVAPGTIPVSADTKYSPSVGYGLLDSAQIRNGDQAIGDDWERDFVTGTSIPFQVDLPQGSYDITLMTGNEAGLEYMTVLANSSTISTIYNTAPKEIKETTLRVQHPGGALILEVRDTGGLSKNAVLNGLTITRVAPWAPIPQVAVADPSLTIIVPGYVEAVSIFDRIEASIEPIKKIVTTVGALLSPAAPLKAFTIVKSIATVAQSTSKLIKALSNKAPDVPAWTFTQQIDSNYRNALLGLPIQRFAFSGTLLTTLESMTNEEQQKLLKHEDVIIINAQKQLNDGVKPYGAFDDKVSDAEAYKKSNDRVAAQIYRVTANKGRAIGLANSPQQLDVQIIAEDFAAVAARKAIDRFAQEEGMLAAKLGYVELLALNPISVEQTDKLYVNYPETRPFHYVVHNFWEDVTDVAKGFVKGPLDKEEGGNYHGVEAGIVREFSKEVELGLSRYKNFNKDNKPVQGEIAKLSYHDNGLIAYANANGYLSIVDTKNDRRVFQDRIFKSKPIDLKHSPDGKNLAILNEKGVVAILNLTTLRISRLNLPNGFDVGLNWLDSNRLILAGSGGAIQAISVTADGQLGPASLLGRIADKVTDLWLDPVSANQQPRLVSVHEDRSIQIWILDNKSQPQLVIKSVLPGKYQVLDADTVRGNILISDGSAVQVLQISTNQLVSTLTLTDTAKDTRTTAGRLSNDGTLFVTGGDDQQLRVYDLSAALNRQRVLVKNYKSVMPEVRAIELSQNGDRLFVSYKDAKGGKTLDRNIGEAVSKRIPLLDKLFGDEFSKAKLLPTVVFEEYGDKLRFHARRDRADLDALYGQAAKQDGWKFALPNSVDEVFADDDALVGDTLNNLLPPKFQRSIADATIQSPLVVDLKQLALDPEGSSITYSAKSSNTTVVTATVMSEQLVLAPIDEGSSTITLVATDGLHTATLTFKVTTDGSLDRRRFADLRAELDFVQAEQKQLRKGNEGVDESIKALRKSVEKTESDMSDYQKRLTRLTADLSEASAATQSIRSTITTVTRDRDAALNDLQNARRGVELSQREVDAAAAQLSRARDVEAARQREFEAARTRFENARAANRAARRAEMNAAKGALDVATADRVAKQQLSQSANTALNQWVDRRRAAATRVDDLETRLQRLDRSLKDAVGVESRAKQVLDQHIAQRAVLVSTRDQLLVRLGREQETAIANARTASRLTASLQGLVGKLQTLRAEKWVKNLGLDAWEKDSLQPARQAQEPLTANSNSNVQVYLNLSERLRSL